MFVPVTVHLYNTVHLMVKGAMTQARDVAIEMPTSEVMDQLLIIHQELSKANFQLASPVMQALRLQQPGPKESAPKRVLTPSEQTAAREMAPRPETVAGNPGVQEPHIDLQATRSLLRLVEAHGDPVALHKALKEIYVRGFCTIREEKVTHEMLNQLSFEDLLRIAENYIANFIFASWLRRSLTPMNH